MKQTQKISLANLPTPLEQVEFRNRKFLIKRDDYTGTDYSGNKIRKLEYLLYQAKRDRAEIIFTCGGEQSNHCRATASAASRLGLKTKLFLWGNDSKHSDGNLFLDKLYGAEINFLNKQNYMDVNEIMAEESDQLIKKGRRVYVIPEGGSTALGIWGYITFIDELKKQIDLRKVDGILSASGTGGTTAGMLVGAALHKLKLKIYAVNVLYSAEEIKKKIMFLAEAVVADYNLSCKVHESNLVILNGYSNEGYTKISDDKVKLISNFSKETGILLDPTYTGKAFKAYNNNFLKKVKRSRIIFLHTGGLFGSFAKRKKYLEKL